MIFMIKINKSKVAVISDLHLGVHSNSTAWHDIAIKWCMWLRDELTNKKIKDIIFCGDWYHNRSEISVMTLQISADILNILKDFNIIALVGNHDIFYKNRTDVNSLAIFKNSKNISVIDSIEKIEAFDRVLTFCPWGTQADKIEKSDVVFGHFEIETFKMNNYKDCEEGLSVKDLLSKSSLIISGHFHFRHEKKYGAGTILYVGNPFQMDFGDVNNDKGYHILDIETNEYSFIKNPVSPLYKKIYLSELIAYQTITEEVEEIFRNNIVKLKIDRNITQEDLLIITSKLNLLRPEALIVEYDMTFNKIKDKDVQKDLSGIDITQAIDEFINTLDLTNKKEVLDYTIELYQRCTA
jgi:DNA repair exonuclease SbcCD nuclease subunit